MNDIISSTLARKKSTQAGTENNAKWNDDRIYDNRLVNSKGYLNNIERNQWGTGMVAETLLIK